MEKQMSPEQSGKRQSEGFGLRGAVCPLPLPNTFRIRDRKKTHKTNVEIINNQ